METTKALVPELLSPAGDMERFQALLMEKNRYKNQFPIPE